MGGAALFTRPFDAVLFGAVVGALVMWRRRRDVAGLLPLIAGAAATVVPIVLLLMLHNRHVTGGWLDFPLGATSPENRFGFGARQILPGEEVVDYSFAVARGAFRENVRGLASWLSGGLVLVGLGLGALRDPDRRSERFTLVALAAAFPLGYLFWWATAWSAPGATNGIGPHYYLSAVPAILILGADGLRALAEHRRGAALALALAALGLGVTLWALPDKVDHHRWTTGVLEERLAVLPDDLADAVVLLDWESDYIGIPNPHMVNDPALENPVLYAVDTRVELPPEASSAGRVHTYSFHLEPEDLGAAELLVVGVELTTAEDPDGGDRYEQRIDVAGGERLAIAAPGRGWWRVRFASGSSWLAADVGHVIDVSVADGG